MGQQTRYEKLGEEVKRVEEAMKTVSPYAGTEARSVVYNGMEHRYVAPPLLGYPKVLWLSMGGRGRVPYNKYRGDAGYDLFISRPALIAPRSFADVHTDVAIEMPRGLWGRITGRSSTLRKRGLLVNEGVIDGEYRGELFIGVFNLQDDAVQVEEGDRIGQIIFQSQEIVTWEERKTLTISDRGTEGFGSTGK